MEGDGTTRDETSEEVEEQEANDEGMEESSGTNKERLPRRLSTTIRI